MDHDGHPVILFDGVCNLCNAAVDFVIRRDTRRVFRYGALQSGTGEKLLEEHGVDLDPDDLSTFVLLEEGRVFTRSTAALRIARRLGGAWPLCYGFIVVPRVVRDAVYRVVSRNRYHWFGRRDTCRLPTEEEKALFV